MILDIKVRDIGNRYQEVIVSFEGISITIGTMDEAEAKELAMDFIYAATTLLEAGR